MKDFYFEQFTVAYWESQTAAMKEIIAIGKSFDFFQELESYFIDNQMIEVRTVSQHTFNDEAHFFSNLEQLNSTILQTIHKNLSETDKLVYNYPILSEIFVQEGENTI